MVKDELRKLLNQPYKSENWKKITEFVFPNVSYLQKPQEIPFESDKVESFKQIGNVKLSDGKNLAMFEVHVAENVNLASNRVELRKLVAPLIDQERNHGVLVIYEQGKDEYRFTFTAKSTEFDEEEGDFVNIETDAKRFTYILGKNESCKTAANRFWELSGNKDTATIKDVELAFSVERLNKEFFDKYKSFYEDFVQHITGKRFEKEKGKWVEKTKGKPIPEHKTVFSSDDKLARNFVKLLLGRLVFIQFLQKKGWMGVPANSKKWRDGERDFTYQLFNSCKDKNKFHSSALIDLFYNAFNRPNRPNDLFELTGTRVPYLNGGLFENEYKKTELIDFPANYFQDLLDFFGQYNFTIDENDPLDHEVGIDPEMLGHIFENLLEDNKDKGAFYTPKPIVQYMCQESLIQYLKTYLIENNKWSSDEKKSIELNDSIIKFVKNKAASGIISLDDHIATALRDVKICDPAIGSGAFPMGLLNEIFYCMQVLHDASPDVVEEIWKMNSWQADIVKKNIIQHSIYGVDLEKGAVDIARLRFWLSLIVDEKEPYPLPNLDFKIMQGNSLLESFEGIDLSNIAGNKIEVNETSLDLFGNQINSQATIFDTTYIDDSNISELIEQYFNAQEPEKKQSLKNQIDTIIHKHIDFNLEFEESKIKNVISDLEFKINGNKIHKTDSKGVAEKKEKTLEKLNTAFTKEKERLKNLQKKIKELHNLQNTAERPYFLWNLFFKEIFDNGGFDIVIGNPPYLDYREIDSEVRRKFSDSKTALNSSRPNLYQYFIEKSFNILKEKGTLNYINPNQFLSTDNGFGTRKHLIENAFINFIKDVSHIKVFENASTYTIIWQLSKICLDDYGIQVTKCRSLADLNMVDFAITKAEIIKDEKFNIPIGLDYAIANKIEEDSIQLKTLVDDICWGTSASGYGKLKIDKEDFDKLKDSQKEKYAKIYQTSDIKSYFIDWQKEYIPINIFSDAVIKKFNQKKVLIGRLTKRFQASVDSSKSFVGKSTLITGFSKIDPFALVGILNSKLINKWYSVKFETTHMQGGYIRFDVPYIEQIPITKYHNNERLKQLSIEICQLKNKGINVSDLVDELDILLYKLYQINFNELLIFDPELKITEKEYNNYKI